MDLKKLKDKSVFVVGLGISGQSAVSFLLKRGARVTACDKMESTFKTSKTIEALIQRGLKAIPETLSINVADFDMVVVSPGISHEHFLYRKAKEYKIKIVGEVELAAQEIKKPCLAVTGTNGKTTVTSLVEHILKKAGINAKAFGNIGYPITSAIDEPGFSEIEIVILELSSFQIETLEDRFIDAAVILNITPDHLDRYASMQDYAIAKARIKDNLKPEGKLFVEAECYKQYGPLFNGKSLLTYGYLNENLGAHFQRLLFKSENGLINTLRIYFDGESIIYEGREKMALPEKYRGKKSHDVENIMAAFALCKETGISPKSFLSGLLSFEKPPHRIEFVRTVSGVHFINDSKGTNIDAVIRAVEVVDGKVVLIAGGVDKGFPYDSWIFSLKEKVKMILSIGESKEKIKRDLKNQIPVELFSSLEEAVKFGAKIAAPGETVLLSPGCSSYDMFKDYAHRGTEFRRIVNALREEEG